MTEPFSVEDAQPRLPAHEIENTNDTIETDGLLSDDDHTDTDGQRGPPPPRRQVLEDGGPSDGNRDMVSVPLATLEQLVQYCSQVVRESKQLKTRIPDLERNESPHETQTKGSHFPAVETDSEDTQGRNLFNLSHVQEGFSDKFGEELMEDIWRKVVPWELRKVQVMPDEYFEGEEYMKSAVARFRTVDDLGVLFTNTKIHKMDVSSFPAGSLGHREPPYQRRLRSLIKAWVSSGAGPTEREKYGAMASFIACIGQDILSIGAILAQCYRMKVLVQPIGSEASHYLEHIWLIIEISLLWNRYVKMSFMWNPLYMWDSSHVILHAYDNKSEIEAILTRRKSLEEVLGLTIPGLYQVLHAASQSFENNLKLEMASGPTFRPNDLNIVSLREIGGLSIKWTYVLDDHLRLDIRTRTLYVLWYDLELMWSEFRDFESRIISHLPSAYFDGPKNKLVEPRELYDEIAVSWKTLFTTSGECTNRDLANYDSIMNPPDPTGIRWVTGPLEISKDEREYQKLKHLGRLWELRNVSRHLRTAEKVVTLPYSRFPVLETRLRMLVFYMDSQKPQGLRQFWRDKRDTLNYYTFWGVMIFGGLSVFLALFSLAVSIAQTVASFRALNSAPSSGTSSG